MILADRYAFIPKATNWQMQAGLLAHPTFRRLPNNSEVVSDMGAGKP